MTTNNRHLVGSNLVGEVLPGARHLLGEVWDKISGNISDSEKRREFASKKLAETLARANAEKLVLAESPTVPESGLTDLTSLIDARDRVIVFPFPGSAIYKRDMKKWSEKCARSIPGDFPFFSGAGSVAVRGVVGENDGRCPESKRLVNYLSEFANKYGIGAEPDGQAVVTLPRSVLGIHDDPNVNNYRSVKDWTLGAVGAGEDSPFDGMGGRSLVVCVDHLTLARLVGKNSSNRLGVTSDSARLNEQGSFLILADVEVRGDEIVPLYSFGSIKD